MQLNAHTEGGSGGPGSPIPESRQRCSKRNTILYNKNMYSKVYIWAACEIFVDVFLLLTVIIFWDKPQFSLKRFLHRPPITVYISFLTPQRPHWCHQLPTTEQNWEETCLCVCLFFFFTHMASIRMRNVITNESVSERVECHSWHGIWLGISLLGLARCLCALMWLSTSPLRSHY